MLELNRIVTKPGVCLIGGTTLYAEGLEAAIDMMGLEDVAVTLDTPLQKIYERVANDEYGGNGDDIAEFAGRQCYRSWTKGRSHEEYIANVIEDRHGSVFAHANILLQVIGVSRTLTHELVRHHIGTNYSQESQRYVDAKDLRFVMPPLMANKLIGTNIHGTEDEVLGYYRDTIKGFEQWSSACASALNAYTELQPYLVELAQEAEAAWVAGDIKASTSAKKRANEAARSVLPGCAETRMVFSCNLRAIRYILNQRGSMAADLEIRRFAVAVAEEAREYAPVFFNDIETVIASDLLPSIEMEVGHI